MTLAACLMVVRVVLAIREKLEDNLVNAMETMDNDQGTSQSAHKKPGLMFKIASKSKTAVDFTFHTMVSMTTTGRSRHFYRMVD